MPRGARYNNELLPCGTRASYARGCRCTGCREANNLRRRLQYAEDPAQSRSTVHRYYQLNRVRILSYKQDHYEANKPAFSVRGAVRRARAARAEGSHTLAERSDRLEWFEHRCAYCGVTLVDIDWDHGTPLVRGGTNWIANLYPSCPTCNNTKYTKIVAEFLDWRRMRNLPLHPKATTT